MKGLGTETKGRLFAKVLYAWTLALTRFGAAHPIAAESAVITPRAPMAPPKTCTIKEGEKGGGETVRADG